MRYALTMFLGSALSLGAAHVALASEIPVKVPVHKAPPATVVAANWTGFYAGLNAGGSWGGDPINNSGTLNLCVGANVQCVQAPGAIPGQFNTQPRGFIGGGQIGYNWRRGAVVWGVETDFQASGIKGEDSATGSKSIPGWPGLDYIASGTGSQRIDWFGTLRGRVGWLPVNSLLVYATGGLAYGHLQTDVTFSGFVSSSAGVPLATIQSTVAASSAIRAGWTVGGGLELMLAPQWTIKGEYLYYDLGTVTLNQTVNFNGGGILATVGVGVQSQAQYWGHIARIGVNYHL
jgi:outer membrane immunogenic protein